MVMAVVLKTTGIKPLEVRLLCPPQFCCTISMKIVVTHSSGFNFRDELYKPIRASLLNTEHNFLLPQEKERGRITKEIIKNADLVFAEVSYPSTGQGIELGWANIFNTPIVCFYKTSMKISSALKYVTNNLIEYADEKNLIEKLDTFLRGFKE